MSAVLFVLIYLAIPGAIIWFGIRRHRGRARRIGVGVLITYALVVLVVGPLGLLGARGVAQPPSVRVVRIDGPTSKP